MKRRLSFLPDTSYEGRDECAMDVDRFINEGMAGGSVFRYGLRTNIEEARELEPESPPAD
ncbi:hypothetical protein [Jeotgalibacillus terrae]|uniref:Uncharacterized protein n=1 Tax=Jeotgalibacillus terrae TaxID=587735 RepID=A0ABW5ZHH9_9BACL|nr:hypothetical protein [Jeotgalibacillus terrae]MBM7579841.1 hypothetical protein [Jeotgalibacillus terrae]